LIYAGKTSNALESVGSINNIGPEKSQGHGVNQQGINKYDEQFLKWFIGFTEGDGCFYISGGKSIFSIHLHLVDLPLLYEIKTKLNIGNIYIHKNSCYFIVKAKLEIGILISIFNGNLYLNKKKERFAI
jgi:hypothetical protein